MVLGDRVGRKRTFLAGLVAFAGGSAWAAFSGSVGVLIAARASMGVGAALMMPSTLSIIADDALHIVDHHRCVPRRPGAAARDRLLGRDQRPGVCPWADRRRPAARPLLVGIGVPDHVPIAAAGLLCAIPLVPDSKNPAALRPDFTGAVLSIAGLALVLWSIIEAPTRGWTSPLVIGAGLGGLVVLTAFAAWERASSHPMLNLRFFRSRSFSGAISSVSLVMFALAGSLFLLTQFLQFELGYSALQAGVRMLPVAAALAVIAPLSSVVVRHAGTKLTVAAGLLLVAAGFCQISQASVTWTYTSSLPGMIMIGIGAALVITSATASVMGSLPRGDTGTGPPPTACPSRSAAPWGWRSSAACCPPDTRTG